MGGSGYGRGEELVDSGSKTGQQPPARNSTGQAVNQMVSGLNWEQRACTHVSRSKAWTKVRESSSLLTYKAPTWCRGPWYTNLGSSPRMQKIFLQSICEAKYQAEALSLLGLGRQGGHTPAYGDA